jgi:hypothetical protein
MSLSDLASVGSFVSGVAVLISLIYLGLQTRQNVLHTRALIQQGRSGQVGAMLGLIAADPSLAELMVRAGRDTLTDADIIRVSYWYYAMFINLEDQVHQHERGLIDDDRYYSTLEGARETIRSPSGRIAWKLLGNRFNPRFRKIMDDLMLSTPAGSGSMRVAWQEHATGKNDSA